MLIKDAMLPLNENMQFVTSEFLTKKNNSNTAKGDFLYQNSEINIELVEPTENTKWIIATNESNEVVGILSKELLYEWQNKLLKLKLKEMYAIVHSAHNGILAIDADGKITLINPAAARMAKCNSQEAVGKRLNDIVIPTGLLEVVSTRQKQFGIKYQVGKRKYVTNRTPVIDEEGVLRGAVGVFQDISEIEKISDELFYVKQLNRKLNTLISSSYDGIAILDEKFNVVQVNNSFCKMFEISEEEIVGNLAKDIIGEKKLEILQRKKLPYSYLLDISSAKSLAVTLNPIINKINSIEGAVINVRDMTELNQLKGALEESLNKIEKYKSEVEQIRKSFLAKNEIICNSKAMQNVVDLAVRVALVNSTVLIEGESGVGKEVISKIIHKFSERKNESFIKVNCGAIPENLLESELFGYESGAFTGADKKGKPGLFELADKGTIFLDEIGELPQSLQVKLLRVLQEKEIMRLGGTLTKKIDVRVISATNKDLAKEVEKGHFREDLFFRLNVIPIYVPPLRERKEDIFPLIKAIEHRLSAHYQIKKEFTKETLDALSEYSWPGNIRELENIIERLYVTTTDFVVGVESLPMNIREILTAEGKDLVDIKDIMPLKDAVDILESKLIGMAIKQFGNTYKAAKVLGVHQSTVSRKLKRVSLG